MEKRIPKPNRRYMNDLNEDNCINRYTKKKKVDAEKKPVNGAKKKKIDDDPRHKKVSTQPEKENIVAGEKKIDHKRLVAEKKHLRAAVSKKKKSDFDLDSEKETVPAGSTKKNSQSGRGNKKVKGDAEKKDVSFTDAGIKKKNIQSGPGNKRVKGNGEKKDVSVTDPADKKKNIESGHANKKVATKKKKYVSKYHIDCSEIAQSINLHDLRKFLSDQLTEKEKSIRKLRVKVDDHKIRIKCDGFLEKLVIRSFVKKFLKSVNLVSVTKVTCSSKRAYKICNK